MNEKKLTSGEMDLLPKGSVVLVDDGRVWQKAVENLWQQPGNNTTHTASNVVRMFGQVTLLHVPEPKMPTVPGSRIRLTRTPHMGIGEYEELVLVPESVDRSESDRNIWRVVKYDGRYGVFGFFESGSLLSIPGYEFEVLFDAGAA